VTTIINNAVTVAVDFLLRDNSGNIDRKYSEVPWRACRGAA
jgi:hypothetical protein